MSVLLTDFHTLAIPDFWQTEENGVTLPHVIKVHHRLHRFEQFIINQTTDTEKIILLICVICGEN